MRTYALTVALNAAVDVSYLMNGLAPGQIHTTASVQRVAGGKANNVARVLRLLGMPVKTTGFAGGHTGAFIQSDLHRLGIDTDFEMLDGESRTCLAIVDHVGGTLTEIREKGPEVSPTAAAAFLARFRRLVNGARVVVMSGSLPPGLPADFYAQLTRIAQAEGTYSVLDSSGAALQEGVRVGPSLVKPNQEELATWTGSALSDRLEEVLGRAEQMRHGGADAVAVSLGEKGLVYAGPEGAWAARPPVVKAVNTVGSGDSLVAGFTAGMMQGLPLPECLRLGVACGTANALTSEVASPGLSDMERIRADVIVERY